MKKHVVLLFFLCLLFTGCGIQSGLTFNQNNHQTSVVLSKSNYKIVGKVQGEASAKYYFGFGGLNKAGLIAEARQKMLAKSNLIGSSRAIINETVEVNTTFLFVYLERKIIVSAYVIEFNDEGCCAGQKMDECRDKPLVNGSSKVDSLQIPSRQQAAHQSQIANQPGGVVQSRTPSKDGFNVGDVVLYYSRKREKYLEGKILSVSGDTTELNIIDGKTGEEKSIVVPSRDLLKKDRM